MRASEIEIVKALSLMGLHPYRNVSLRAIILYISLMLINVDLIIALINNWDSIDLRILALEDLNVNIVAFSIASEFVFLRKKTFNYFSMESNAKFHINGKASTNGKDDSSDLKRRMLEREGELVEAIKRIVLVLISITLSNAVFPILITCYLYFVENIDTMDLPLPIEISYNSKLNNFFAFTIVLIYEEIIYSCYSLLAFSEFAISLVVYRDLVFEMEMFCVRIDEFEKLDTKQQNSSRELKHFVRRLAVCHQSIIKKILICQNILRNQVFYVCQGFCSQLCISAFIIQNGETLLMKFKYGSILIAITMALVTFCRGAQQLLNKNDRMESALYNFDWHSKPAWFQKDFHILMTEMKIEPTMKFFGIIKLDQSSLSSVFKGAYSYLNILNSLAEFK